METRRNYKQFCGLARALDRVGERWTLLIVRNLLLGPKRYSDLLEELPGITTNLLAARLREMESTGLVEKRKAAPPVRATVYELGATGRALEPAIMELARWGARFMDGPREDDTANIAWGMLSLKRRYRGGASLVAAIRVEERSFELVFTPTYLSVTEGTATRPDVSVTTTLSAMRAWLFRRADAETLRASGALGVVGSEPAWDTLRAVIALKERSADAVTERLACRDAPPADAPEA
jgi:DNA-binding HxlR family transcriptional regulator